MMLPPVSLLNSGRTEARRCPGQRQDGERNADLAVFPERNGDALPPAFSTTIKLATEPSTVRFPANVLDIASASQAVSWLAAGTACNTGSISRTAGTLLTRFDNPADTRLNKINRSVQQPVPAVDAPLRHDMNLEGVDDDEQAREHHQQAPVDLTVHLLRLGPPEQ